jgi:hypothetical protein
MAHVHGGSGMGRYIGFSIVLTALFVAGEAAAGYWSNSLALISDAGHNLADVLALVFSWYAVHASKWPADSKRTFGYHRVGILAALVNAVSLVLVALFIFWEAAHRLNSPEPVQGGLMIGVALAAIVVNGIISFWLHADAKNDLNVRSAYLHMLGDALSAVGVVIAGIIAATTGATIADQGCLPNSRSIGGSRPSCLVAWLIHERLQPPRPDRRSERPRRPTDSARGCINAKREIWDRTLDHSGGGREMRSAGTALRSSGQLI